VPYSHHTYSEQKPINYKTFASGGSKRTRQENGLVELTKKFIDLIKESEN
jgi:hypothetical protein